MLNKNNAVIKMFSSVDLALILISTIAVTSIAGTLIPQGESIEFYAQRYGVKPALILELFNITDMYSSYWFQGLLLIFCLNLMICTLIRLPGVIAIIRKNSLNLPHDSLTTNNDSITLLSSTGYTGANTTIIEKALSSFSVRSREAHKNTHLFLYEKGAWSRTGAYIVHASLLLIIAGALVGKLFGYDAFVMVKEGSSEASVYRQVDGYPEVPLGFSVFCRNFTTEYYDNGTPREYRSELTVLESDKKVMDKSITVNDPLKYKGITFFQSSYKAIENEYRLLVRKKSKHDPDSDVKRTFYLNPFNERESEELGISLKILATSNDGHGHGPYTIQFDDATQSPVTRRIKDNEAIIIERNAHIYTISLAQRFATGLKVVKDPGVWIVYIGCSLLMLGLYISFFMSHIRIWILYQGDVDTAQIRIVGKTNKNTAKLEQLREKIINTLLAEEQLALKRS